MVIEQLSLHCSSCPRSSPRSSSGARAGRSGRAWLARLADAGRDPRLAVAARTRSYARTAPFSLGRSRHGRCRQSAGKRTWPPAKAPSTIEALATRHSAAESSEFFPSITHRVLIFAGQLVLNALDQLNEAVIVQALAGRRRPMVEGAARQLDHLAPSDGTGFGPVTIDKFSLSLTRCRLGVFLTKFNSTVSWSTLRSRAAILASYSAMTYASASSALSSPRSYCASQS